MASVAQIGQMRNAHKIFAIYIAKQINVYNFSLDYPHFVN
jgi:hypothetical protein